MDALYPEGRINLLRSLIDEDEFNPEKANIKDTIELATKIKIPLVVSGGISSIDDIKKIKSLNNSNIEGVIVGKSIYDGDIKINDLAELI